jgi:LmbE family N-acetylglucosaminyl deacetylase
MSNSRTLLAVFPHPDDESVVAPILARYAREGHDVYVVYGTDGQRGVRPHFQIPPGMTLGEVRRREAECASRELGIKAPIFLGFDDGSLGEFSNSPGRVLRELQDALEKVFEDLNPDAVITWGPDGGYGHPDHRLMQDVVTQIVQSSRTHYGLYYFGISRESMQGTSGPFSGFLATNARYLTVQVPFQDADLAAARRSFRCHQSQFTEDTLHDLDAFFTSAWSGKVSFRPWSGEKHGDELF